MNKSLFLVALGFIMVATGCNESRFQKADDGSEYKIEVNKNGTLAAPGNILQLEVLAKYGDSILHSTVEYGMPSFVPYDTVNLPKFFRTIHEGDSVTIKEATDSIIAKNQAAPWIKAGKFIITGIKVVKVLPNKEAADSIMKTFEPRAKGIAYDKAVSKIKEEMTKNDAQMKTDDKIITDYLASKNLTNAKKTDWGVYTIITTPGKSFQDSTFDSNTDKKFEHMQPLYVDMGEFRVIPGWIDGLKQFNKGAKGKIVIPSSLAYGLNGAPPKIKPNENIVFDIEVTDIITQEAYQKQMEEQQKMMQMMQQQMQQQQQQQQAPPAGK